MSYRSPERCQARAATAQAARRPASSRRRTWSRPKSVELSELEFGLIVAWNAFSRWAVRCMAAAGCPELTITDVLVLHHICHRARNKKLGDICFVLNVEDTHVVGYSLKKLLAAGLAQGEKIGKEVFYSPTRGRRDGGREVPRGARGLPDRQPRRRPQRRHRRGARACCARCRACTTRPRARRRRSDASPAPRRRACSRRASRACRGDIGNPATFAFPVRYRVVARRARRGACVIDARPRRCSRRSSMRRAR